MRFYQVQQALEEFLIPQLISYSDSHIVGETVLKLAQVKQQPEIITFGTRNSESSTNFNIGGMSQEDAQILEAFLKKTCGDKNVTVDRNVNVQAYNCQIYASYDCVIDASSFYTNLLPLLKDEIEKLSPEQIEQYQKKSANNDQVKFYKDCLQDYTFLQTVIRQFEELKASSDDFTKGQLTALFDVLKYFVWELDNNKHERASDDFIRAIRADNHAFIEREEVSPQLNTENIHNMVDICKQSFKHNPNLRKNTAAKELKHNLVKFAETAHFHPALPEGLIQSLSLFKSPAKDKSVANSEEKQDLSCPKPGAV